MHRDRGFTLVEMTVVVAIIGVLMTVISGGIVVLLRSQPVVDRSIGESHDQQQLLNYLYEDVRATNAVDVNTAYELLGYTREPLAPGCGPDGSLGHNVLQLTWRDGGGLQRSSYRLVDGVQGALLQRDHCTVPAGDVWPTPDPVGMAVTSTNVADRLDPVPADWTNAGAPAHVSVEGDVVTVVLSQQGRELRASATLRNDLGQLPAPPGTTPPPTTAAPTTTTTATVPPTTSPPVTGGVTSGVCSLLGLINAVLASPTAGTGELLREYGADGLAGILSAEATVSASISVGINVDVLGLSLSLELCTTIQAGYSPSPGVNRLVPMQVTGVCTVEVNVLLAKVCLAATLSLTARLPIATADLWTTGSHPLWLANAAGVAVPGATGSVNVGVNPSSIPPIAVPTVGQGQPYNPFAAINGFSAMVEGDTALSGATVNGALATGGNLTFSSAAASVATSSAAAVTAPGDSSALGLAVGGAIDLNATPATSLTVTNGFAHSGSLPGAAVLTLGDDTHVVPTGVTATTGSPRLSVTGADQTNQAKYPVVRSSFYPFVNTFLSLDRSSAGVAALSPNNCPVGHPTTPAQPGLEFPEVYKQSGNWVLNLVPGVSGAPKVNVLNLTSKQLEAMTSVSGTGAPGAFTTLVINVTDHGNVSVTPPTWTRNTTWRAQSIVWNFPNANRVTISGTLRGSILAPAAQLTLSGATVQGDLVASKLTTSATSTVELSHFDQLLPCIG